MLLEDYPTRKIHVDFIVQKEAVSFAGAPNEPEDWFRMTVFKSNDGGADWNYKVVNLSPEQAKALAVAIMKHYAPWADKYIEGIPERIFERPKIEGVVT